MNFDRPLTYMSKYKPVSRAYLGKNHFFSTFELTSNDFALIRCLTMAIYAYDPVLFLISFVSQLSLVESDHYLQALSGNAETYIRYAENAALFQY